MTTILKNAGPSCLVASRFKSQIGIPAIFPKDYYGQLLNIKGDQGAKGVLEANIQHLVSVPIIEAAIDIDTPKDLIAVRDSYRSVPVMVRAVFWED